jgi:hypothetical protein
MSSILIKLLILMELFDDDEPLNLILEEVKIGEDTKKILKENFRSEQIDTQEIKKALIDLITEDFIELLDEHGNRVSYEIKELHTIVDSTEEWKYWFRIKQNGRKFFEENYEAFFIEEEIR